MDEQQELAIARGLLDGKAEAWRALYDAHAEHVWRAVTRLMPPSSTEVADIVQETFLAAARSADTFDSARGTLWQWLWGIARRAVALHYRKQEQRERLRQASSRLSGHDDELLRFLVGREESPPDALATAELVALVRGTLAELPDDYELLLTAKYLEGGSIAQIAKQVNCSFTAAHSKLARARRAFREAFDKHALPLEGLKKRGQDP